MAVTIGLDRLREEGFASLKGKSVGLVCNQASLSIDLSHALDIFYEASDAGTFKLAAIFGPQHGLFGHTQDNMIEWEGRRDAVRQIPIYSLYGEVREPTPTMLAGLDTLVIDLVDVGSRYYTFAWTLANCMKACDAQGIEVVVLDRPNPISGTNTEGSTVQPDFKSFVGLYPLIIRHGMTMGEIATYLKQNYFPSIQLTVVELKNWDRGQYFDETGLTWAMPSPNLPTLDSAIVYPGMCLLEGTNLSEGRGTTRPFEIFGAPYLHGSQLCSHLNGLKLPGVYFRPIEFLPTFQKHMGIVCGGATIHVLDRHVYRPVLTTMAILQGAIQLGGTGFEWKQPPYEYEYVKLPIDILFGNDWLRPAVQNLTPLPEILDFMESEVTNFAPLRQQALLY